MINNLYNSAFLKKISILKYTNQFLYNKGLYRKAKLVASGENASFLIDSGRSNFTELTKNLSWSRIGLNSNRGKSTININSNFAFLNVENCWGSQQHAKYMYTLNFALKNFRYFQLSGCIKQIFLLYPKKKGFCAYSNGFMGWLQSSEISSLMNFFSYSFFFAEVGKQYFLFSGVKSIPCAQGLLLCYSTKKNFKKDLNFLKFETSLFFLLQEKGGDLVCVFLKGLQNTRGDACFSLKKTKKV